MKRLSLAVAVITATSAPSLTAQTAMLPELPQVSGPFTLEAVTDPVSGKSQFRYDGYDVPPVVRVRPGEDIHIECINRLSRDSKEKCVMMPCTNGTNLHFHGLHVSPQKPQDDILPCLRLRARRSDTRLKYHAISLRVSTGTTPINIWRVIARIWTECPGPSW